MSASFLGHVNNPGEARWWLWCESTTATTTTNRTFKSLISIDIDAVRCFFPRFLSDNRITTTTSPSTRANSIPKRTMVKLLLHTLRRRVFLPSARAKAPNSRCVAFIHKIMQIRRHLPRLPSPESKSSTSSISSTSPLSDPFV